MDEGKALIDNNHYASDEIQTEMDRVQKLWEQLLKECQERGIKPIKNLAKEQSRTFFFNIR